MMRLKKLGAGIVLLIGITSVEAMNVGFADVSASVSLKVPGNAAKRY